MNGPLFFPEAPFPEIPADEWEEYDLALDGEDRRRVLGCGRPYRCDPLFFLPPWMMR